MTKLKRGELHVKKSHAGDAYAMGDFHPKHRTDTLHFRKRRRNGRILEKFYDAKYLDTRDGTKKSGSQLSCGRTDRSETRHTDKNERPFRGQKQSRGRRSIRRQRYPLRPGDLVTYQGERFSVIGVQNLGSYVKLSNGKAVQIAKVTIYKHMSGWECVS